MEKTWEEKGRESEEQMRVTCVVCGWKGDGVKDAGLVACPNEFCPSQGAAAERVQQGFQSEDGSQTRAQRDKLRLHLAERVRTLETKLACLKRCRDMWRLQELEGGER